MCYVVFFPGKLAKNVWVNEKKDVDKVIQNLLILWTLPKLSIIEIVCVCLSSCMHDECATPTVYN